MLWLGGVKKKEAWYVQKSKSKIVKSRKMTWSSSIFKPFHKSLIINLTSYFSILTQQRCSPKPTALLCCNVAFFWWSKNTPNHHGHVETHLQGCQAGQFLRRHRLFLGHLQHHETKIHHWWMGSGGLGAPWWFGVLGSLKIERHFVA